MSHQPIARPASHLPLIPMATDQTTPVRPASPLPFSHESFDVPFHGSREAITARGGEDMVADCEQLNGLSLEASRANARYLAHAANAYPQLVQALAQIRDATHSGTARDDFTVRREVFEIAQRELVALGHTPYEWEAS